MAIVLGNSNQQFNVPIGTTKSHDVQAYDDGGLPLDAAQITNNHASLTGLISVAIVSGKGRITIDATALAAGTYWYEVKFSTDGGSTWSANPGGQVCVYTEVVETITIGAGATHTMTADLPSAGKTKLVVNFGSSTSILDGSASHYKIVTTDCKGGISLNGPGKCYRLGTTPGFNGDTNNLAIFHSANGDDGLTIDQIDFDTCAGIYYRHYLYKDGLLTFTSNTIETNAVITIDSSSGSISNYALFVDRSGTHEYRDQITGNRCGLSAIAMDVDWFDCTDNIGTGYRGGLVVGANRIGWTMRRNYVEAVHCSDYSQVAVLDIGTDAVPSDFGDNILRRGEWHIRAAGGFTIADCVFADQESHSMIDGAGSTRDTVVERNIFLPTTVTYGCGPDTGAYLVNPNAWVHVRGDHFKVRHNTFIGAGVPRSPAPAILINSDRVLDTLQNNLFVGLRIDRGVTIAGDAVVAPGDATGLPQDISGSPLRPASTPNRMTTADHNGFYNNASDSSDAFGSYGVGTVSGSPGTGDVTTDPQFVTGTYTFPSDSDIWNRVSTVAQMLTAIRAAFTLGSSSPMRNAASDATHIGAVQLAAPAAAGAKIIFRNSAYV